jgi:hypothetical protein
MPLSGKFPRTWTPFRHDPIPAGGIISRFDPQVGWMDNSREEDSFVIFPLRAIPAIVAAVVGICILPAAGFSCDVPVFRYALERWMPDLHDLVIIHDGPLSPEERSR